MKTVLVLAMIAACSGGGGAKPPAPVVNPDPVPMAEPAPKQESAAKPEPAPEPEPAKPDPERVKSELLAAETAAYEQAKPVFEANCARCHSEGGRAATDKKRDHFDMTSYPFGGHHAMEIAKEIRKSLGITGGKPTMPYDKKGSVKGDDLALIAAWADAFDAAHAAGAHAGHDHAHGHAH